MAYKFQKGTFKTDGTLDVSAGDIDLPNTSVDTADLANSAVTAAKIAAAVAGNGLSGGGGSALALDLNELSAASVDVAADSIAIIDAGDNSSKKESWADMMAGSAGTGLTASGGQLAVDLSEVSAAAVDVANDSLLLIDANDSNATKKESFADLATAMAGTVTTTGIAAASGVLKLDIQNMTASTSISDSDLIVVDDGANGTLRKMTRANFIESAALDSINIDGGAIDGTIIGANAQAAASFTTVSGSSNFQAGGNITLAGSLLPDVASGSDLGSTSAELGDVFVGDDKYVQFGSDQDVKLGYDEASRNGLVFEAVEGAALDMYLMADNGDDAGDEWKIRVADGGVLTFGNDKASAGTHVSLLTMTPNSTTVDSNMTWAGDLTVSGDLTINGDLTTVATTNTVVKDLRIELGNGTTGSAAADAGIIIERGDDDNVGIIWDESADTFALIDGSFTGGTAGNDLTIADYMSLKLGALTATDASDFEAGVVGQDVRIGIAAAAEIDTSAGNLTIDSAGGTVVIDDILSVNGNLSVNSNFDVTAGNGNLTMAGNLTVSGTGLSSTAGTFKMSKGMVNSISSSSDATVTLDGNVHFFIAQVGNGSTMTVTLPAASAQNEGMSMKIKAGANCDGSDTVTIDANGSQTIDGAANLVLNSPYAAVNLMSSGSEWFIW